MFESKFTQISIESKTHAENMVQNKHKFIELFTTASSLTSMYVGKLVFFVIEIVKQKKIRRIQ